MPTSSLTPDQIRPIIQEAVRETLAELGIHVSEDGARDMAEDLAWLRELRQTSKEFKKKGLMVLITTLIAAAASAVWLGIRASLK